MDLLVGVIEHLPDSLDDVGQVATDLLGCAVGHGAEGFDTGELGAPLVGGEALEEDGEHLLDGVVAEGSHDYLVGLVRSTTHLVLLVSNTQLYVGQDGC